MRCSVTSSSDMYMLVLLDKHGVVAAPMRGFAAKRGIVKLRRAVQRNRPNIVPPGHRGPVTLTRRKQDAGLIDPIAKARARADRSRDCQDLYCCRPEFHHY
jgi:hypothetical protein